MSTPQPTREYGERLELPQQGPGQNPGGDGFWHILKATERSFLYMTKSEGGNLH